MEPGSSWVFAIKENDLPESSMNVAFPRGVAVLFIKKDGQVHAVSNKCAHMACPLASGTLEDHTIKCPCHDWKFDVRTGEFLDAKEVKIPVYDLKVSEGKVFVKMKDRSK